MSIIGESFEEEIIKNKYFMIHDLDQQENLFEIRKDKEESLQIISEEEELIDEYPQDIKDEKSFQLINNNGIDDFDPSKIEIRPSITQNLKEINLSFNNKIDDFLDDNQNHTQQNIIIDIEKETKKDNDDNNNILNVDDVKKEKEQLFYVNKKILFSPSGIPEIRNMINEIKKSKPKEKKKKSYNKRPFKIILGSKPKVKLKRKLKPDNIRKKIKSIFLKLLKQKINQKLTIAESKLHFDCLPQCFISNITKKGNNNNILNMTLKELMLTNFLDKSMGKTFLRKRDRNSDLKKERIKYAKNVKIINYLEKNPKISKKANFNIIQKMTVTSLFNEYLESKEFEENIIKLKEKEDDEYIKDYIIKAYDFIKYFSQSN